MVIVKRFHYEIHDQLRQHFGDFVAAYNFARRLNTCRASRHTNSFAICGRKSHQNLRIIRTAKHGTEQLAAMRNAPVDLMTAKRLAACAEVAIAGLPNWPER